MVPKYAYIMVKGSCAYDDDNSVYTVDYEIPAHHVMLLMLKDHAETCNFYLTNGSDDIGDWDLLSTFGDIEKFGVFADCTSH